MEFQVNTQHSKKEANQTETPADDGVSKETMLLKSVFEKNAAVMEVNSQAFTTLFLALIALCVSVFVIWSISGRNAPPLHIPTDSEMRYSSPVKRSVHSKTDSEIATYSAETISSMFTYDWYNIANQLGVQVKNFTNKGWMEFKDNLERSNVLAMVKDYKYISTFVVTSAPEVINKEVVDIDGQPTASWTVRLQGKVQYLNSASGSISRTDHARILLKVVRVSTLESDSGIAINRANIEWISGR